MGEPTRYTMEKTIEFGSPDMKIVTGQTVVLGQDYDALADRLAKTEAMRAQRAERVVQLDLEMIGLAKQIVSLEAENMLLLSDDVHAACSVRMTKAESAVRYVVDECERAFQLLGMDGPDEAIMGPVWTACYKVCKDTLREKEGA